MKNGHAALRVAEQAEADAVRRAAQIEPNDPDTLAKLNEVSTDVRNAETVRQAIVRVNRNEPTYRADGGRGRDGQRETPNYLADLITVTRWGGNAEDPGAVERLDRNNREVLAAHPEARSYDGAGFLPPAFILTDPVLFSRAARPAADFFASDQPLPKGGSVRMPRITVGASGTFESVDLETDEAVYDVVTVAPSFTDVSQQIVDQGQLGAAALYADVRAALDAEMDRQVLVGTGTGELEGLLTVSTPVTYDDADPTAAEFLPKLGKAVSDSAVFGALDGTAIIMAPRRWTWLSVSKALEALTFDLDSPLPGDPFGTVARALGCYVMVDGNMPLTLTADEEDETPPADQDAIIVLHRRSAILLESAVPQFVTFPVVDASAEDLLVRVRLHTYAVLAARVPDGIISVEGTGMNAVLA